MACTNYLVAKCGSSPSPSTHFSYAADAGSVYGTLGHYPAGNHAAGTMKKIYDWDSGVYLGEIPEVSHTYNVVGNINEFQLAIGETTFGGLQELSGQKATMDYGNLIWTTLQRAKNAREAITTMGELVSEYGYASEGESFTIGDPNELWILEMIGKGAGEKGAVWVAQRIPDCMVAGHANQARIRTFDWNDADNVVYAPDVLTFAVKKGLYPASAPKEQFSFSDTFDPVTFTGARLGEVRVWHFFQAVAKDRSFGLKYLDYAQGRNLTNRMPLWVEPAAPVSVNDTMEFMRTHYEGTFFDMTADVGAGSFNAAYRVRPLVWTYKGQRYVNERPVGAQQTGWHFVAQLRSWLPNPVGGILWFGVDDTSHSAHTPIYCSTTRVPESWADGNGDALTFSFDSAFWVFNMVANFAYSRYSVVHPVVAARIHQTEALFFQQVAGADEEAVSMIKQNKTAEAVEYLTAFSVKTANTLVKDWLMFWQELFVKYRDGFIITLPNINPPPDHGGAQGGIVPHVVEPGYPNSSWYGRIVAETGDHYQWPAGVDGEEMTALDHRKLSVLK